MCHKRAFQGAWRNGLSWQGFTLVELVLVTTVSLVGAVTLSGIFIALDEMKQGETTRVELVQATRAAAERMITELRLAKAVALGEDDAIEFTADIGAGDVSIRYYRYDPGNGRTPPFYLYRAEGYVSPGDGQPIATLMETSWSTINPPEPATPRVEFRYYDAGENRLVTPLSAADRNLVRRFGVTLNLENLEDGLDPPSPYVSVISRWAVVPRNIR